MMSNQEAIDFVASEFKLHGEKGFCLFIIVMLW